jgi:DNA-binding NarL/FixJ family response regulator
MPGTGGLDALRRVKGAFESAVVVVLSSEEDPRLIRAAIHEGAGGFIPKTSTPAVLLSALQLVMAGGRLPAAARAARHRRRHDPRPSEALG